MTSDTFRWIFKPIFQPRDFQNRQRPLYSNPLPSDLRRTGDRGKSLNNLHPIQGNVPPMQETDPSKNLSINRPETIHKGFHLGEPDVFVPWGITEDDLFAIIPKDNLHHVTGGYYTLPCRVLGVLEIMIGFHFDDFTKNLYKFEFFRTSYPDLKVSYDEFQEYLEKLFGEPHKSIGGGDGFPDNEWTFGSIKVFHYIADRFGPEEHVHIERMEDR